MQKRLRLLKTLISVCVILIALLLVFGCVSHVSGGNSGNDMYSAASVKAHFAAFGWAYIGAISMISVLSCGWTLMKKPPLLFRDSSGYRRARTLHARALVFVRIAVFACSAVLIVLGIINGGLYDVFVKAVNICTECIGLG